VVRLPSIFFFAVGLALAGTPAQQENTSTNAFAGESVSRGEKIKMEGVVISRQGNIVTMRTGDSGKVDISITDYTKVVTPDGLLGKKQRPVSDLVPGLWVKVKGIGDSPGHLVAESISFSPKDLKTANAIQAGLFPLDTEVQDSKRQIQVNVQDIQANQQQIQTSQAMIHANQQQIGETMKRVSEITDYDVKSKTAVYFPVSSAALSTQAQSALMGLVRNAAGLKGYFLEVKGFTDSSGSAARNQELSMRRAQSVIAYLQEAGKIPLTHVFTPGGMGEAQPISSNETAQGRAENRRVEVKVLVSRGLAEP
jgi:outer membrane protein OmpA-like peptidoglycan-associated protein